MPTPEGMNQPISESSSGTVIEILARPNRSASASGLALALGVLAASVLAVAAFSFAYGNVFAPLFALADIALVLVCFRLVWRRGEDRDRIRIDAGSLRIERERREGRSAAEYPTPWVRVWREPKAAGQALYLGAYGRRTEVGAFLGAEQRDRLEQIIKTRLGEARSPSPSHSFSDLARGQLA